MNERLEFVIGNTLEEIPAAVERIADWLRLRDCPSEAVLFVSLCIEEIVSNCVKYGYDDSVHHEVFLGIETGAERVTVEIRDDGHEFDPLSAPEPDTSLPVDQRPIGGLGLAMVLRMADGATYSRQAGVNRLVLWKSLS